MPFLAIEKREDFATISIVGILILGIIIGPALFESAEGLKGQGWSAEQFGKNTKNTVCGGKLCSEVKADEKKAEEDTKLKEKIEQKLIEMRKLQSVSVNAEDFQNKTKEKSDWPSGEYLTKSGKIPTVKMMEVILSAKNVYSLNFQVCATNEANMRAPEVVISSDSIVKNVKLNKIILKDTCAKAVSSIKAIDSSSIGIKAIDSSSIGIKAIDKTNLNKKIEKNEKEFEKLEVEIADVKYQIRIKSNLISWQMPDYELAKEINGLAMELSELRKQKDQLKIEYYDLIYKIKGNQD